MRRRKSEIIYKSLILALLMSMILFFGIDPAWATTYNIACSGDITSALNSAISSAVKDDIISIGPGTCSSSGITVMDKQLTIQGAVHLYNVPERGCAGFAPIFEESTDEQDWFVFQ